MRVLDGGINPVRKYNQAVRPGRDVEDAREHHSLGGDTHKTSFSRAGISVNVFFVAIIYYHVHTSLVIISIYFYLDTFVAVYLSTTFTMQHPLRKTNY
ncbi:MAG: hypothetical protein NVS2B12_38130 [Ktedonobacteraceae bacterium]